MCLGSGGWLKQLFTMKCEKTKLIPYKTKHHHLLARGIHWIEHSHFVKTKENTKTHLNICFRPKNVKESVHFFLTFF